MVHKVNKKAISFYQKHGFVVEIEKGTQLQRPKCAFLKLEELRKIS